MADVFLPVVTAEDHDTFRRLLRPHLPATYQEWSYLHFMQTAELNGQGHTVTKVKIDPLEFVRYLRRPGIAADGESLDRYATEKGGRGAT
jgi:hypothetical protein